MKNNSPSTSYPSYSIFLFRRDLRVHDNTGLLEALKSDSIVIPLFIFDPAQSKELNPYFSDFSFGFLLQSLKDLSLELESLHSQLYVLKREPNSVITELFKHYPIRALYFNRDYTLFAKKRDQGLYRLGKELGIDVHQFADALLLEPEDGVKENGEPYTVFTPFFRKNSLKEVRIPSAQFQGELFNESLTSSFSGSLTETIKKQIKFSPIHGGRKEGLRLLQKIKAPYNYQETRDFPALSSTTLLSPHLKFGTLSAREVYYSVLKILGASHPLIRQLYWRDFFTHIAYHFPHIFKGPFREKYNNIEWQDNQITFQAWCDGRTGFPIVDAGMRELNATGFMHNRTRMITASFLVKDLHLDWRQGERYFATRLVDYDPAVNNGNWQWAASTGCDAQPYFRIFNPWLQQKKFDPNCKYIKHWVSELKNFTAKEIHLEREPGNTIGNNYPSPLLDHSLASEEARELFAEA